jgi:L-lactate utilization protein LutB
MTQLSPSVQTYYRSVFEERLKPELARRNIAAHYCQTGDEARELVLSMIPDGAMVMAGSSTTMEQIGLEAALKAEQRFDYMRTRVRAHNDKMIRDEARRLSTVAEFYLGSANAISLTGEILLADSSGNRVAGYAFGGRRVIIVAGVNKLVQTVDEAMRRVRTAATQEAIRLDHHPPCRPDGICRNYECYPPDRQCGKMLIIEKENEPGRMDLVLIEEVLGF